MTERNVLGGDLAECGTDPMTGYYRDGTCTCGTFDIGLHAVCAIVTADFLDHQASIGNDLTTPLPEFGFPGLRPGDAWCVVASRWYASYLVGKAAPVILAATNERCLDVIPLPALIALAVDVPDDAEGIDT